MTIIMIIIITAAGFGVVGTPLARKIAIKSGFIAVPKADRSHTEPTALMGGLAIYGAAIGALLLVAFLATLLVGNLFRLQEFASIIIGASLMAAIGFFDDRKALPPWKKLGFQLAPVILVFAFGVRVQFPFLGGSFWSGLLNFAVTASWILYITNAVNYLDHADGVAIMTSATTSAIFMLIAILNDQYLVSILAATILGASTSFAFYNLPLPRSTIFMGDSGSLFLGYFLAVLGIKIRIPENVIYITWMVPLIVLGLPIFDTILVLVSRTRRGRSFFQGGIDHSTHRLSRLGMDGLSVALAVGFINCILGLIAIFVTQASLAESYVVAASLVSIALYVLWQLEFKASYYLRTGKDAPDNVL